MVESCKRFKIINSYIRHKKNLYGGLKKALPFKEGLKFTVQTN